LNTASSAAVSTVDNNDNMESWKAAKLGPIPASPYGLRFEAFGVGLSVFGAKTHVNPYMRHILSNRLNFGVSTPDLARVVTSHHVALTRAGLLRKPVDVCRPRRNAGSLRCSSCRDDLGCSLFVTFCKEALNPRAHNVQPSTNCQYPYPPMASRLRPSRCTCGSVMPT
jgi:hypothetical protein